MVYGYIKHSNLSYHGAPEEGCARVSTTKRRRRQIVYRSASDADAATAGDNDATVAAEARQWSTKFRAAYKACTLPSFAAAVIRRCRNHRRHRLVALSFSRLLTLLVVVRCTCDTRSYLPTASCDFLDPATGIRRVPNTHRIVVVSSLSARTWYAAQPSTTRRVTCTRADDDVLMIAGCHANRSARRRRCRVQIRPTKWKCTSCYRYVNIGTVFIIF